MSRRSRAAVFGLGALACAALAASLANGYRNRVSDQYGPVPGLDLMRRLKDEMDPDHRLSPGRFVGGI